MEVSVGEGHNLTEAEQIAATAADVNGTLGSAGLNMANPAPAAIEAQATNPAPAAIEAQATNAGTGGDYIANLGANATNKAPTKAEALAHVAAEDAAHIAFSEHWQQRIKDGHAAIDNMLARSPVHLDQLQLLRTLLNDLHRLL